MVHVEKCMLWGGWPILGRELPASCTQTQHALLKQTFFEKLEDFCFSETCPCNNISNLKNSSRACLPLL